MDYFKIQTKRLVSLLILFLAYVPINTYAQVDSVSEKILSKLYSIDNDTPSNNDNYLIITQRNCYSCFSQLCDYYSEIGFTDSMNVIVVMPKDYLALLSIRARHKLGITCAKSIYFLFINESNKNEFKEIINSPSPQLLLFNNERLSYIPYGEVLKILNRDK